MSWPFFILNGYILAKHLLRLNYIAVRGMMSSLLYAYRVSNIAYTQKLAMIPLMDDDKSLPSNSLMP